MFNDPLLLWSNHPGVSAAIWLALAVLALYLARQPAHALLRSTGRSVYKLMRLCSRALTQLEKQLIQRNREVLIGDAKMQMERAIEREFARIATVVNRDLAQYPALHRRISDAVKQVEEDYHSSSDSPPLPPQWDEVLNTVAALPQQHDVAAAKILSNIEEVIQEAHAETLEAYQENNHRRHKLLASLHPHCRSISDSMSQVKKTFDGLATRSDEIDKQMQRYEEIRRGEDDTVRTLTSSSLTQFFISGLVLIVATLGGLINFQLIALPMSEMVGGTSYIGAMKTSDIAALVIILIEIAMGLFLLESLRITRLFPLISSMDDRMRRRMIVITLSILFILASIEASLAYMRDLLAMDREALKQSLAGVTASHAEFRWIPSIGQMVMGFILPFALAFIAIPLESLIHSLRTVIGLIAVAAVRSLAIASRLIGGLADQISKVLVAAYDMLIMLPLSIERAIRQRLTKQATPAPVIEHIDMDDHPYNTHNAKASH